ncbi:MAG: glycine reductase, partial [Desulfitobacteriaceae bacterium]|nr:glycine reductase [Desulfitobacteriaceae bacterium]
MSTNRIRETIVEVFEDVADALETGSFGKKIRVGLTILGSEHGPEELVSGAEIAETKNANIQVVLIGSCAASKL